MTEFCTVGKREFRRGLGFFFPKIQKCNSLKSSREIARPALLNKIILCNSSAPSVYKDLRTLDICLVHSYLSIHMSQVGKRRGKLIDRLVGLPNVR